MMLISLNCAKDDIISLPSLNTIEISAITEVSATSGGSILDIGSDDIMEKGVCWSSSILEPSISGDATTEGSGNNSFSSSMNNLTSGTTYYVRAYATSANGTAYGATAFFKTNTTLPKVTTLEVNSITQTTAKCGGEISSNGVSLIIDRGVCWNTESLPDTSNEKTNNGSGFGDFISNLDGLDANTTYYVRAYATINEGRTAYGTEMTFKTKAEMPNIATEEASLITQTTALSGGNITSNGGASIRHRGVCWATLESPTIANNKTTSGTGNGIFASELSGLLPNTTYFFRAYATNDEDLTGYGNELSITTLPATIEYNSASNFGDNVLDPSLTEVQEYTNYSLAAILPENTSLKIKISSNTAYMWSYSLGSNLNWMITTPSTREQTFTSVNIGNCDLRVQFVAGMVTIDYFENGAVIPTRTKQLIIK